MNFSSMRQAPRPSSVHTGIGVTLSFESARNERDEGARFSGQVGRTFGFPGLPLTLLLPRYYASTFHIEM